MTFRGPALQHKLRKGTTNNVTGDAQVITIPGVIANQFAGCLLRVFTSGNCIILESGCKMNVNEVNILEKNTYFGARGIEYTYSGKKVFIK